MYAKTPTIGLTAAASAGAMSKWCYAALRHKYKACKLRFRQVSRGLTCNLITDRNTEARLQAAWKTDENQHECLLEEASCRSSARSSDVEMRVREARYSSSRPVSNPTTMYEYKPDDENGDGSNDDGNAINHALTRAEKYEAREQPARDRVRSLCYKDGSMAIIDYDELDAWLSSNVTINTEAVR